MAFFEIFRKNLFLKKKSFISLCVNLDTLYNLYTINMAKCENLLFLLPLAAWGLYRGRGGRSPLNWAPYLQLRALHCCVFYRSYQVWVFHLVEQRNTGGLVMLRIPTNSVFRSVVQIAKNELYYTELACQLLQHLVYDWTEKASAGKDSSAIVLPLKQMSKNLHFNTFYYTTSSIWDLF